MPPLKNRKHLLSAAANLKAFGSRRWSLVASLVVSAAGRTHRLFYSGYYLWIRRLFLNCFCKQFCSALSVVCWLVLACKGIMGPLLCHVQPSGFSVLRLCLLIQIYCIWSRSEWRENETEGEKAVMDWIHRIQMVAVMHIKPLNKIGSPLPFVNVDASTQIPSRTHTQNCSSPLHSLSLSEKPFSQRCKFIKDLTWNFDLNFTALFLMLLLHFEGWFRG